LPDDVDVLTKQELLDRESRYWQDNTAIGFIFSLGMVVGFIVGIIICYQILYTNVNNYLPQFATLKAIGYTDGHLVGVVLQQAVFLAVLGFIPALAVSQLLFSVVAGLTGLLMFLTPLRIGSIFVLTVAMCVVSGAMAVRRILTADPAEVFR
jgi:putative ABC transport system permease protein